MAIVSMKKMRLLALKRDKGRILGQLQKMGCVELIQEDQAPEQKALPAEDGRLQSVREEVARLDRAVDELKPLCRGGSLLAVKPEKSEDDAMQAMASEGETLAVVDRLEETARSLQEIRGRRAREEASIAKLKPWETLNLPLEQIADTKHTYMRLITVPANSYAAFEAALSGFEAPAALEKVSADRTTVYALAVLLAEDRKPFEDALRQAGGQEAQLAETGGTPALLIDRHKSSLTRLDEVQGQLQDERQQLAEHIDQIRLLRDMLFLEQKRLEAAQKFAQTESAFLLTGWAPADKEESIRAQVGKVAQVCEMEFRVLAAGRATAHASEKPEAGASLRIHRSTIFHPVAQGHRPHADHDAVFRLLLRADALGRSLWYRAGHCNGHSGLSAPGKGQHRRHCVGIVCLLGGHGDLGRSAGQLVRHRGHSAVDRFYAHVGSFEDDGSVPGAGPVPHCGGTVRGHVHELQAEKALGRAV